MASTRTEKLRSEPSLEELFSEPIVRLIMQRDGINETDMRGEIDRVRRSYKSFIDAQ